MAYGKKSSADVETLDRIVVPWHGHVVSWPRANQKKKTVTRPGKRRISDPPRTKGKSVTIFLWLSILISMSKKIFIYINCRFSLTHSPFNNFSLIKISSAKSPTNQLAPFVSFQSIWMKSSLMSWAWEKNSIANSCRVVVTSNQHRNFSLGVLVTSTLFHYIFMRHWSDNFVEL